jgi:hypothetical protein
MKTDAIEKALKAVRELPGDLKEHRATLLAGLEKAGDGDLEVTRAVTEALEIINRVLLSLGCETSGS